MNKRGNLSAGYKRKKFLNNSKRRIRKKQDIPEKINYQKVKEAFDKKLIPDLNHQTFFENPDGTYPSLLCAALENKDKELFNFLLERGVDLNIVFPDGRTCFSKFFRQIPYIYDLDFLNKLINAGLNINLRGTGSIVHRYKPLTEALRAGHLSVAEFLIKNGADLEPACLDPEQCYGCYPLQCAVTNIIPPDHIVELLLAKGVAIDKYCKGDYPPLYIAARRNNIKVMKWLLDRGADVNSIYVRYHDHSCYPSIPLLGALEGDHLEVLEFLLNYELTDVNIYHPDNIYSAVHCAVRSNSFKCIDVLLNANPDVNIVTKHNFDDENKIALELTEMGGGDRNLKIKEKLKIHIIKLRAAGFYLNDRNLAEVSKKKYQSFYTECCQEVEAMKTTTISPKSHVNFYDVLFMTHQKLALCLESLEDQKILHCGFQEKFPSYAGLIEFKLKKSYQWIKLQEELYIAVYSLFGKDLPSTIMQQIFKYFSAADLVELRRHRLKYQELEMNNDE